MSLKKIRRPYLLFLILFIPAQLCHCDPLPAGPDLIHPPDGHTVVENTTPWIMWEQPAYDNFEIYISSQDGQVVQKAILNRTANENTEYHVPKCLLDSDKIYVWKVRAVDYEGRKLTQWSETWAFKTDYLCSIGTYPDRDCDGIQDSVEAFLKTNPLKKTLFIRPKKQVSKTKLIYWEQFIELFPGDPRVGFAHIPQLDKFDIEVLVIGAPGHQYERFSCPKDGDPSNDFCNDYRDFNYEYHPSVSDQLLAELNIPDNKLPCRIMEIQLLIEDDTDNFCGAQCKKPFVNKGHTYFENIITYIEGEATSKYTWVWDQYAYLGGENQSSHYRIPTIFSFPIDMYFKEGAYESIDLGKEPITDDCKDSNQNGEKLCTKISPMNLDDTQGPIQLPITVAHDHSSENDTVEFLPVQYDATGKMTHLFSDIQFDESMERATLIDPTNNTVYIKPFKKNEVLKTTVVHEIGHALMDGDDGDHCLNTDCIMFKYTFDWNPRKFGARCGERYCCKHNRCGTHDIRKGVQNKYDTLE